MAELCEAIAAADREAGDRYGARPYRTRFGTDALPARVRGYRAISVTCLGEDGYVPGYHTPLDTVERLDPAALERGHEFCLELVRQLDRDVERKLTVPSG